MSHGDRVVGDGPLTDPGQASVRETRISAEGHDLSVFIVAGEHSGDALGAKLMAALNMRAGAGASAIWAWVAPRWRGTV